MKTSREKQIENILIMNNQIIHCYLTEQPHKELMSRKMLNQLIKNILK